MRLFNINNNFSAQSLLNFCDTLKILLLLLILNSTEKRTILVNFFDQNYLRYLHILVVLTDGLHLNIYDSK